MKKVLLKIFASFAAATWIGLVFYAFLLMSYSHKIHEKKIIDQALQLIGTEIEIKSKDIQNRINSIKTNDAVGNALLLANEVNDHSVFTDTLKLVITSAGFEDYVVYDKDGNLLLASGNPILEFANNVPADAKMFIANTGSTYQCAKMSNSLYGEPAGSVVVCDKYRDNWMSDTGESMGVQTIVSNVDDAKNNENYKWRSVNGIMLGASAPRWRQTWIWYSLAIGTAIATILVAIILVLHLKWVDRTIIHRLRSYTKTVENGIKHLERDEWENLLKINLRDDDDEIATFAGAYNILLGKLAEARENLKKSTKEEAFREMALQVVHDIRKPLSGMKALLAILPQNLDGDEDLHKMARGIEGAIDRTNSMLSELLMFSGEGDNLQLKNCNPQSILTAAISEVLSTAGNSSINIVYDLRSRNYLYADSNKIIRAFGNIINNAVEAMGNKGKLWIKTEDLPAEEPGMPMVRLVIGNNGPVIPSNVIKRIFDPFFTLGKKSGTGLGLAICRKMAEMHHGRIYVESEPGKTEFIFELPARAGNILINEDELIYGSDELRVFQDEGIARVEYGDAANVTEFMRINKERERHSHLLIVDDEPLFRETVRCLLNNIAQIRDHVKVIETDSAESGLSLLAEHEFDYVIADIDLGRQKMNGYEFSQLVLEKYPNTHVLIHSNKRKEELDKNIRKISSDKFMGFLPKPMKISELLQFLACRTFETKQAQTDTDAGHKKSVLVLNDDDDMLMTFKMLLKPHGVQVLEASNVSAAIKKFSDNHVDIILSDVNLGEGEENGYDFLKKVRQSDSAIPFYLVSGYSRAEHESKARDLGATGYVQLPIDKTQLKELLQ